MFGFGRAAARGRFLRQAKDEVRKQLKANGFALVADELAAAGVALPTMGVLSDGVINQMWAKAERAGELSDDVILDYAASPAVGAPVGEDGPILTFLRRIIEWISDPANQEKLMAVIKFIMSLLVMFGI